MGMSFTLHKSGTAFIPVISRREGPVAATRYRELREPNCCFVQLLSPPAHRHHQAAWSRAMDDRHSICRRRYLQSDI